MVCAMQFDVFFLFGCPLFAANVAQS